MGAVPSTIDLFDPGDVQAAMAGHDAVFHFATSIPPLMKMRRRNAWEANNRLRADTTPILVEAALDAGIGLFVQESITFFYADGGESWLDENSPIEPAWDVLQSALTAERHVARFSRSGGRGVSLRLSRLYGPGTVSGEYLDLVAARRMPVIGDGDNYISQIHVYDVATALEAALDAPTGVFNVTDDDPVTAARDMETVTELLGVDAALRLRPGLARLVIGPPAKWLALSHRVSNQQFKTATVWAPRYPSALDGWEQVLESA